MKNAMVIKLILTDVSRKKILNVWLVQEHKTYSLPTFAAQSKDCANNVYQIIFFIQKGSSKDRL